MGESTQVLLTSTRVCSQAFLSQRTYSCMSQAPDVDVRLHMVICQMACTPLLDLDGALAYSGRSKVKRTTQAPDMQQQPMRPQQPGSTSTGAAWRKGAARARRSCCLGRLLLLLLPQRVDRRVSQALRRAAPCRQHGHPRSQTESLVSFRCTRQPTRHHSCLFSICQHTEQAAERSLPARTRTNKPHRCFRRREPGAP
jgi:hypothetical protein